MRVTELQYVVRKLLRGEANPSASKRGTGERGIWGPGGGGFRMPGQQLLQGYPPSLISISM